MLTIIIDIILVIINLTKTCPARSLGRSVLLIVSEAQGSSFVRSESNGTDSIWLLAWSLSVRVKDGDGADGGEEDLLDNHHNDVNLMLSGKSLCPSMRGLLASNRATLSFVLS